MGYPVSHVFDWDEGAHRLYGWKLLIAWLIFGALVNAVQLILHAGIPQLRKQPCCRIIIWLSSVDFAFDFICLFQCSFNLYAKSFFGEQLFCTFQAFWAELLMAMSGFSIACTMLASYMAIIYNRVLTTKEIDCLHIIAFFYCTLLSVVGSVYPGKGTLNSSGLFCYTATQYVLEGVLFHIGYVLPLISVLLFFWIRMYQRVKEMTQFLAKRQINVGARKGQVQMAKRMAWYIYILLLCFVPYEIAVWYSWITGEHAPYQMWITFGMFGHVLTVASPILYYVLNKSARHLVSQALKQFFCSCRCRDRGDGLSSSVSLQRSRSNSSGDSSTSPTVVGLRSKVRKPTTIDNLQLAELTKALSNSSILNQMLAFADAQWCSEGILFWIDVQVWRGMVQKFSASAASSMSPPSSPIDESSEQKEMKQILSEEPQGENVIVSDRDLNALRDFARSVYLTYFVRGSAPLELNIPDEMHNKIIRDLKITNQKKISCQFESSSDLLYIFDSAEKEILRLLYDNIFIPFCNKVNLQDILASEARLKNLYSGDALPFNTTIIGDDREMQGDDIAASVIIPRVGSGGVSTGSAFSNRHSRYDEMDESFSNEVSFSSRIPTSPNRSPQNSEILHVGIDAGSSIKLIFKDREATLLGPSVTSTPSLSATSYNGPPLPSIDEIELVNINKDEG